MYYQVQKSACMQSSATVSTHQNWYYGLQAMYSSIALKSGGPCTFGPPTLPESGGSGLGHYFGSSWFNWCICVHHLMYGVWVYDHRTFLLFQYDFSNSTANVHTTHRFYCISAMFSHVFYCSLIDLQFLCYAAYAGAIVGLTCLSKTTWLDKLISC